ncbi:MAG: ASCH domain-containing protein [Nanoarchaeota archaeon]
MKVLSLKQPFAELILQGRKKIELRKWNTHFRGEFLIHSSKISDGKNMKKFGFTELPCGSILGKANLVNVKKYDNDVEFLKDKSLHLADKSWGGYGFVLDNVKRINPLPAKGQLNFWEFDLK